MVVNTDMLKSPLNIMKMLNMLSGIVIAGLIGSYTRRTAVGLESRCQNECDEQYPFANDRYVFILVYGLLVLVWSLILFLLYLFDVTMRFDVGTMRTLEIVGAVFLLMLALQATAYGVGAAKHFQGMHDTNNEKARAEVTDAKKQPYLEKAANAYSDRSYNAATTSFIIITMLTLIITVWVAYQCGVPGPPPVPPRDYPGATLP